MKSTELLWVYNGSHLGALRAKCWIMCDRWRSGVIPACLSSQPIKGG